MSNDPYQADYKINNGPYPPAVDNSADPTLYSASSANPYYNVPDDASILPPPPPGLLYGVNAEANPYAVRGGVPPYNGAAQYPAYKQCGNAAPYYQAGMTPVPATLQPTKRSSGRKIALFVVLAFVIIFGAIVTIAALAVARTPAPVGHPPINVQGTAQAQAIATAHTQATATAIVSTYPFSAALKMDDTLANNTHNNGWDTTDSCLFKKGSYHALDTQTNTYSTCFASNTSFSDFTYQVSMKITKGYAGGVIFRGDAVNQTYYGLICSTDGEYYLYVYPKGGANPRQLQHGTSKQFHTGIGQMNVIGIVARGSTMTYYINGEQVTSASDKKYSSGQIGVLALDDTSPAEVEYSDAQVWTL